MIRVRGVGRVADEHRAVLVLLSDIPSDDWIRAFHDTLSEWTPTGPALADPAIACEETGWVIEREDSERSRPMYYAGFDWSYDNLKAMRFARFQDAQLMCRYMFPGEPHRIADHMWVPG